MTCIHFNPLDDDYFISGSLDSKVRLWSIPNRSVVDWTDLYEMVTAVSFSPDGQVQLCFRITTLLSASNHFHYSKYASD